MAFPQVAGEGVSRPGTGATMPLAAFLEHGDNVRWTAGMDALLVRAVNELCGLKQLCPWNLTTRLLLATVTPVRPDLDALARDAALPRGGSSTILSQDPQRPWPLGSPAAGSYVTDQAILARFAVLRLFNERLVNVLPFVGLGDGLSCVASPTVMASVWQSKSPVPGLGLGEHPRDYRHGSRSFSQGGGKGLGPMLCTLRGSVFTVSKERVLQAAISRTMTVSKKADDDYDYPDDLPQVGPYSGILSQQPTAADCMSVNLSGVAQPSQGAKGQEGRRSRGSACHVSLCAALRSTKVFDCSLFQ